MRGNGAGSLEILNVQGGDVRITFDSADVAETIRAKRIITDMLRRGYALVVEVERDGERKYERVREFDEAKGDYIIADFNPASPSEAEDANEDEPQGGTEGTKASGVCQCGRPLRHRGRCLGSRRLPMEGTKATAIGRSAGG